MTESAPVPDAPDTFASDAFDPSPLAAPDESVHSAQAPPPPAVCEPGFYLGVLPGQTLGAISVRLGTSVQAILNANPQITNPNLIFAGQIICIPSATMQPCGPGAAVVIVTAGTTFFGLASLFQTTVEAIERANPNVNPENIPIGALLCVPTPLVPQPIPVLPCCITLAAREFGTLGTALLQAFGQLGQFNAQIEVADLPPASEFGDFDRYIAQILVPNDGTFTVPLSVVPGQENLVAGRAVFEPDGFVDLPLETWVFIRPQNSETGDVGPVIVQGSLEQCERQVH
ncbi:MAG TPA: LysM peptidoglycan-binding domain-containing protein [Limnochordia bacterium]|nr:LysM peptidoglycan-binding domain-containing protein [Limnochordia bacterium]